MPSLVNTNPVKRNEKPATGSAARVTKNETSLTENQILQHGLLAYPEDRVGIERHRDEEQLQLVHGVSQDVAASQIHGHNGSAQLKQREETPATKRYAARWRTSVLFAT